MEQHSIVIPVYNEEQGIGNLYQRVERVIGQIGQDCEVIFVNDGSRDESGQQLDELSKKDSRFKVIHFSRNFGHQIAISAGVEYAGGDTVTVMDADLQDPPEMILEFIKKWREGYEVVYGVRQKRKGESFFKLATAQLFYRLLRKITDLDIPVDAGDFRLLDRKVVKALLQVKEKHRYVRGLVSWVGFKQTGVLYDRDVRRFGETHYSFKKMLKLALDGISSFSFLPLKLISKLGFIIIVVALVGLSLGWSAFIEVMLFIGGIQLISIGILGEYLGRIFDEVRNRPLYVVSRLQGNFKDH